MLRKRPLFLVALLAGLCGCDSGAEVKRVTGTVLLNGKPLAGARVTFWPKEKLRLGSFEGVTDEEGRYDIKPNPERGEGHAGEYRALIAQYVKPSQAPTEGLPGVNMEAEVYGINILPRIYRDEKKSPLVVDVYKGVNELPPFNLEMKQLPRLRK